MNCCGANFSLPDCIALEVVNFCNARCGFCPLFQGDDQLDRQVRPTHTMSMELFEKVIEEIASWNQYPNTIYLNVHGEPLMDAFLSKRLILLKEKALAEKVDIQTNGHFLDHEHRMAILNAGVRRLTLGFDAASSSTYNTHRVRCSFDRVLDNIREFAKLRQQLSATTRIAVQYVRTNANRNEITDAYYLFNEFLDPTLDVFQDTSSSNWGSASLQKSGKVLGFTSKNITLTGCPIIGGSMIIYADGSVAACCYDYNYQVVGKPLGNVSTASATQIWNSPFFHKLRQQLANAVKPEDVPARCKSCNWLYSNSDSAKKEEAAINDRVIAQSPHSYTYSFAQRQQTAARLSYFKKR